jgi:actin-related protein 5
MKAIYSIQDQRIVQRVQIPISNYDSIPSNTALIIDNGSSTMRAGFASSSKPTIIVEAVTSKYKDKKTNKTIMLAGTEAYSDNISKAALKTAFEIDMVSSFDPMVS